MKRTITTLVLAVLTLVSTTVPTKAASLDFSMDVCTFDVSDFIIVPDTTETVTVAPTTDNVVVVPPTTADNVVVVPPTSNNNNTSSGTTTTQTPSASTINNYYYMVQKENTTTGTTDAGTTTVTVADKKPSTATKLSRPVIRTYSSSKGFIVGYNAVKGATGYQIRYIQGGSEYKINTGVTTKKVITPGKGKTTVYVRAFAKVNGKTVYSKWSQAAKTTVK